MGNSRSSLQLQQEDITAIQEETGFNQNQIERLYSRSVLGGEENSNSSFSHSLVLCIPFKQIKSFSKCYV